MRPVHVLHIPKTAGTALRHALAPLADRGLVVLHGHRTRLADCPADAPVFAVVREPIDRFVSAFNSRKRQGRPRYFQPWTWGERVAFMIFRTPNALGTALGSRHRAVAGAARWAMRRIKHVNRPLGWWLGTPAALAARGALTIVTVQTLPRDLAVLVARLDPTSACALPDDPVLAHATPPDMDRRLGDAARANLARWYADDLILYHSCLEHADAAGCPADDGL